MYPYHLEVHVELKGINCGDPTSNLSQINKLFQSGSLPSLTNYLSTVQIVCTSGYQWSDTSVKTMNCTASGTWSLIVDCNRIIFFFNYLL